MPASDFQIKGSDPGNLQNKLEVKLIENNTYGLRTALYLRERRTGEIMLNNRTIKGKPVQHEHDH